MSGENKGQLNAHLPLLERLQNSRLFQMAALYRKEVGYGFFALIILLVLILGLTYRTEKNSLNDQYLASQYADELTKTSRPFENREEKTNTPSKTDTDFANLLRLAKDDPLIKARFNGLIAEEFILRDNSKELAPYAKSAIEKLNDSKLPLYASFSKISFLTSENRLKEAYDALLGLKQQKELLDSPTLYAFTLLQAASLERSLGLKENLEKTINELKAMGTSASALSGDATLSKFISHLQDKQASILDFLNEPAGKGVK